MFLHRRPCRRRRDEGASAVEYALLVVAIAAVLLAIIIGLASIVRDAFQNVSACASNGGSSNCQTSPATPR
jgi:Flp pilus assembly pilin Flp